MTFRINVTRPNKTDFVTISLFSLLVISAGIGTAFFVADQQAQAQQQLTFAQFQAPSPSIKSIPTTPLEDGTATATTTTTTTNITNQEQSPTNGSSTIADLSTYANPEFGFTIQYHSNWREIPPSGVSPTQIVSFVSPFEDIQDIMPVSVSISRNDYLSSVTLEGYTQLTSDILQGVGANITQSSPTTLSEMPAHMVVTNNTALTGTVDMLISTVTPDGQKVYTLTYSATPQDFEQYRPIFNEMVNSFRIAEVQEGNDENMQQQ